MNKPDQTPPDEHPDAPESEPLADAEADDAVRRGDPEQRTDGAVERRNQALEDKSLGAPVTGAPTPNNK